MRVFVTIFAGIALLCLGVIGGFILGWEAKPLPPEPAPKPFKFYQLGALAQPYFAGNNTQNSASLACPGPSDPYIFSPDPCPELFGVDLSHHDQSFDFAAFAASGVDFAHVRATHGETIIDRRLQEFANAMASEGIPFATYHFFSSLSDPRAQALNYLDAIAFLEGVPMLPPVLDMEWDLPASDPSSGDRWAALSPKEIADRMETWLRIVEQNTGVKPMIYTNTRWWTQRLGAEGARFKGYPLWIARYGQFSAELPDYPDGFGPEDIAFWQFTEDARVPGITETFNASRLGAAFARKALE